ACSSKSTGPLVESFTPARKILNSSGGSSERTAVNVRVRNFTRYKVWRGAHARNWHALRNASRLKRGTQSSYHTQPSERSRRTHRINSRRRARPRRLAGRGVSRPRPRTHRRGVPRVARGPRATLESRPARVGP